MGSASVLAPARPSTGALMGQSFPLILALSHSSSMHNCVSSPLIFLFSSFLFFFSLSHLPSSRSARTSRKSPSLLLRFLVSSSSLRSQLPSSYSLTVTYSFQTFFHLLLYQRPSITGAPPTTGHSSSLVSLHCQYLSPSYIQL